MSQATWKKTATPLTPRLIRLLREAALYILGAAALFLLISLWTYQPADSAWSHRGPTIVVANAGGRVGAWFADALYGLFGYVAYLFPVMLAVAGWRVYLHRKDIEPVGLRQRLIVGGGFVLALIGACGLASMHFAQAMTGMPFASGGWFGNVIGAGLASAFNFTGATLLLLALFLAGVTLFTGLSWLRVMDAAGRLGFALVAWARAAAAAMIDRVIGMRARRQRRETVEVEKMVLEKHPAPRIEPVVPRAPSSRRLEREKQVPLFETPGASELPPLSLLDPAEKQKPPQFSRQSLESMSRLLEKKLLDFDIEAQVVAVHPGPVITSFEIEPAAGIKASQITNLARDLARSLSVVSLRVVENIPGKTCVGLEIPNEVRETVRLSEVLASQAYEDSPTPLSLALGKDISGNPAVVDLSKMPHLLIAGTTGSGKSVCINSLILSLVYKSTPEQVRMIMIDPKMLELAVYEGIPHLLAPVVTDMKQAANAFKWCIAEMERRYRLMAALGVRNIAGYNRKVKEAADAGKPIADPLAGLGEEAAALAPLPFVVILVDELADLMMVVGKKVEELIARLAQKARAAGLHLVLATQRPSVDVITGLIKANIPTRIAFQMSSRVDSRTVLDQMGAEQLLGQGDMLFLQPGSGVPTRIHGAFVADHEVHKVAGALKKSGAPIYDEQILEGETGVNDYGMLADGEGTGGNGEADPLYDEALRIVTESRRASISGVQRRLRIGYNRAARLIEEMERAGVVGPLQSNGSREVIAPPPPE
ncbi:MAG: cell division protein FtsK [Candidatus Muproteobacteria bacterium RBG_16_65_31]|uniref:Cell division protein FtsK n=1 Tax=Candidatus Muproteobacteria bacterium RBG_16_65_31 TaxID=1817759 RepID=A0A1F6TGA5_9PROT|nr:MAG: cell division protein FtsK [Candidatus Muproteobacteria bacterium RBG_16_65_31]